MIEMRDVKPLWQDTAALSLISLKEKKNSHTKHFAYTFLSFQLHHEKHSREIQK